MLSQYFLYTQNNLQLNKDLWRCHCLLYTRTGWLKNIVKPGLYLSENVMNMTGLVTWQHHTLLNYSKTKYTQAIFWKAYRKMIIKKLGNQYWSLVQFYSWCNLYGRVPLILAWLLFAFIDAAIPGNAINIPVNVFRIQYDQQSAIWWWGQAQIHAWFDKSNYSKKLLTAER